MNYLIFPTIVLSGVVLHLLLKSLPSQSSSCQPTQVRLQLADSYTSKQDADDESDISITFQTLEECQSSFLIVQQDSFVLTVTEHEISHSKYDNVTFCLWPFCQEVTYDQYVHHFKVKLNKLGAFSYSVNGGVKDLKQIQNFLSSSRSFDAIIPQRQHQNGQFQTFLYFGDLDTSDLAQPTWNLLQKLKNDEIQNDAYIFLGDYAYEFWQNNGSYGDIFLEKLEPFASTTPWLWTPGNHEKPLNYSFYNEKIHQPNYKKSQNHYYSMNIGLVHFIQLDLYFYDDGSHDQDLIIKRQMEEWLEQDLIEANQNRAQIPWIIACGHLSVYCVADDCVENPIMYSKFDDLFYKYGVDVFLGAHKHLHQFMKPLYKEQIRGYESPSPDTIKNPNATIYIIQGNGGNFEVDFQRNDQYEDYLLFEDFDTGLGRLTVFNETNLMFETFKSKTESIIDVKHLIKETHQFPQL